MKLKADCYADLMQQVTASNLTDIGGWQLRVLVTIKLQCELLVCTCTCKYVEGFYDGGGKNSH